MVFEVPRLWPRMALLKQQSADSCILKGSCLGDLAPLGGNPVGQCFLRVYGITVLFRDTFLDHFLYTE